MPAARANGRECGAPLPVLAAGGVADSSSPSVYFNSGHCRRKALNKFWGLSRFKKPDLLTRLPDETVTHFNVRNRKDDGAMYRQWNGL